MKPAVFSREAPCTKVHIFNCFWRDGRYVDRLVVEAHAEIGLNAPKYLVREGYASRIPTKTADIYRLTTAGQYWLNVGIKRHLELHPEDIHLCREAPSGFKKPAPVKAVLVRRSRVL